MFSLHCVPHRDHFVKIDFKPIVEKYLAGKLLAEKVIPFDDMGY